MNISLTPELEQLVDEKVKTGMYQTASEVIREGLRLLRERDQRVEPPLRWDVRAGFEAVERGEFTEHDASNIKSSRTASKRVASLKQTSRTAPVEAYPCRQSCRTRPGWHLVLNRHATRQH